MADNTQITLAELQQQGNVSINKKYVLINSSMYTDEAFEYILQLIDEVGSIAFISDQRKIYAQGEYYGGDLWEDTLTSIGEFQIMSGSEVANRITITEPKQAIKLSASDGVMLDVFEDSDGKKLNIGYDIEGSVDDTSFTIDTTAVYNLAVVDGKIKMVKYVPPYVNVSSLSMLEYDNGDKLIEFTIETGGTYPLTKFDITTSLGNDPIQAYNTTTKTIRALIPNNTNVTFIINYGDGKTEDTYTITQEWGFACVYGTEEPTAENWNDLDRWLTASSINKTLTISQDGEEYAYFACPATKKPIFTDASTNLQGGWSKIGKLAIYSTSIEYNIYRTDNAGLGKVKWIITSA